MIGLLDIAGFENFEVNSFEQLCINVSNEQLQHYFNQHIFAWEKKDLENEGVKTSHISFTNNSAILSMFIDVSVTIFNNLIIIVCGLLDITVLHILLFFILPWHLYCKIAAWIAKSHHWYVSREDNFAWVYSVPLCKCMLMLSHWFYASLLFYGNYRNLSGCMHWLMRRVNSPKPLHLVYWRNYASISSNILISRRISPKNRNSLSSIMLDQ